MTPIRTRRLILRNWEDRDRPLFHRINSDDTVMEFFPRRRNRAESDALMDELRADIDRDGYGFAAVELAATGETIGFTGLSLCSDVPHSSPAIEIGWRLSPEFWGQYYATEAATGWIDHGFGRLGLDQIISIAVERNVRSTSVMRRLGFNCDPADDFDHPKIPDTHPHLKRMVCYRLTTLQWESREKAAS